MQRAAAGGGERPATVLWIASTLVAVVGVALTIVALPDLAASDALTSLAAPVAAVVYSSLGWLIVLRTANRVGLIMLAIGACLAALQVGSSYAIVGVLTHPGLPWAKAVGAVSEWFFVPILVSLAVIFLLFPTGRLPSARWRPVAAAGLAAGGVVLAAFIVSPRPVLLPAPGGVSLSYPNPFAVRSIGVLSSLGSVNGGQVVLSFVLLALALVALVLRYRRGEAVVRSQIKWVALAVAAAVITQVVAVIALGACGCRLQDSPVATVAYVMTGLIALLGIPAVITIAILRYRLFEIDLVISRTVVYGALAAALTLIYVTVVVGIGTLIGYAGGPLLTIGAAAVIALVFQPLRRRAQRLANRMVYGERATPYQVLSDFAAQMGGSVDLDQVLDRMVAALGAGAGANRVDLWLRVGTELRPAATWPKDAPPPAAAVPLGVAEDVSAFPGATRSVSVRHGGELLGALVVAKPRNEALTPTEDRLLQDLASQAGLVFREVRLTAELEATVAELRASRRRLVEAQDGERRRLERNLHDGAQQQLVALSVQLALLERIADDPDRVRSSAQTLQGAVKEAIDDLRDLARGIYPPLLADRGLGAALEAQARRAAVPTTVDSDGVGRYPQEIEAAVYFCTLEALQNVAKYAHANAASIRLAESNRTLMFEISDDGAGFDTEATGYGSGLRGMADRIDAIGGRLEVLSRPGRGTVVRGTIGVS